MCSIPKITPDELFERSTNYYELTFTPDNIINLEVLDSQIHEDHFIHLVKITKKINYPHLWSLTSSIKSKDGEELIEKFFYHKYVQDKIRNYETQFGKGSFLRSSSIFNRIQSMFPIIASKFEIDNVIPMSRFDPYFDHAVFGDMEMPLYHTYFNILYLPKDGRPCMLFTLY